MYTHMDDEELVKALAGPANVAASLNPKSKVLPSPPALTRRFPDNFFSRRIHQARHLHCFR